MTASETRRQAREFLKTLTGKYQLFIVTMILWDTSTSISFANAAVPSLILWMWMRLTLEKKLTSKRATKSQKYR